MKEQIKHMTEEELFILKLKTRENIKEICFLISKEKNKSYNLYNKIIDICKKHIKRNFQLENVVLLNKLSSDFINNSKNYNNKIYSLNQITKDYIFIYEETKRKIKVKTLNIINTIKIKPVLQKTKDNIKKEFKDFFINENIEYIYLQELNEKDHGISAHQYFIKGETIKPKYEILKMLFLKKHINQKLGIKYLTTIELNNGFETERGSLKEYIDNMNSVCREFITKKTKKEIQEISLKINIYKSTLTYYKENKKIKLLKNNLIKLYYYIKTKNNGKNRD